MDTALQERLERVRSAISITDICPELKPQGTCDCPACGKRSKLSVWGNQTVKCWSPSCSLNKSRDVVSFYRHLKGLEDRSGFYQALKDLEKLGRIASDSQDSDARSRLLEQCLTIYQHYLWSEQGKEALDYLRSRGFYDEAIQEQGIGFAPSDTCLREWDIDHNALKREGMLKNRREYYSNRIIFPIKNYTGRLVHFVGRYLGEVPKDEYGEDRLPRYKDSQGAGGLPGTKAFLAFENYIPDYLKRPDPYVVLGEGYPDTFTLFQRGIPALGLLGLEKLTSHAHKLKGFKCCICVFDNDTYAANHPTHPLEYKSWRRVIPQLMEMQMILPHVEFYMWMVPEKSKNTEGKTYAAKDINDWVARSGKPMNELWGIVQSQQQEFISAVVDKLGSDISQHGALLKLIAATSRDPHILQRFISPEMSPVEYAIRILT